MVDIYNELVKVLGLTNEKLSDMSSCDDITKSLNRLKEVDIDESFISEMSKLAYACDINKNITEDVIAEYKNKIDTEIIRQQEVLANGVDYTKEIISKYLEPLKRINLKAFDDEVERIDKGDLSGAVELLPLISNRVKEKEFKDINDYIQRILTLLSDADNIRINVDTANELIFSIKHPKMSMNAFFEKLNLLFDNIGSAEEKHEPVEDKRGTYTKLMLNLSILAHLNHEENIDILNKVLDLVKETDLENISKTAVINLVSVSRFVNINILHAKLTCDVLEVVDYGNLIRR